MPTTLTALLIALVFVVPGAAATIGYERAAAPTKVEPQERLIRFLLATPMLFPLIAPVAWKLWVGVLHVPVTDDAGVVVGFENHIATGRAPSWWWSVSAPLVLVFVPALLGFLLAALSGWAASRRAKDSATQAPTARQRVWDHVFSQQGARLISVQLEDGSWVGGLFGSSSFASPRRVEHRELYLERSIELDSTGAPVLDGATRTPILGEDGVMLVKLDAVQRMRVFDAE